MKYNRIPKTELEVSPICLGTMTFGTPVGESDAVKLTQGAVDRGVNFIDTANMYEGYARYIGSPGRVAEEILGKALQGRRDKVILATKVGMKVGDDPVDEYASPEAIRVQIDRSLKRLSTDYVDIYYLHRPDPNTPLADTLGTLDEIIKAGKARYYGISNYSAEETAELLKAADDNGLPRPVIHQPQYSLLKNEIEADLLPLLEREGIGAAPYKILEGGVLTGKYRRGESAPEGSRASEKPGWTLELTDELFDRLGNIEAEAKKKGRTLLEHTLKESLAKPAILSLITGVKRIDQVESLIRAVES